jgi:hypothetical protein
MAAFLIEVVKGEFTAHSFEDACADDAEAFRHAVTLAHRLGACADRELLRDCAIVVRQGTGTMIGRLPLDADQTGPVA